MSSCGCIDGFVEREVIYEDGARSWRLGTCTCWTGLIARALWRVRHEREKALERRRSR